MDNALYDLVAGAGLENILMPKKKFIAEHKNLIKLLRKYDKKPLLKEAKEQEAELKKVVGKGMSDYSKKHRAKLADFARLSPEEQKKRVAEGEKGRQRVIQEIEDKKRKVEEYNAEMKRRKNSPFAPVMEGLTKLGDIAADMGSAVGMPSIVSDVYKKFAPPGSKYHSGAGKAKKWIQKVVQDMKKGAFTKQALRHHMTPKEFAEEVLTHPDKYTLTTRRRALFVKNVGLRGKGDEGDDDELAELFAQKVAVAEAPTSGRESRMEKPIAKKAVAKKAVVIKEDKPKKGTKRRLSTIEEVEEEKEGKGYSDVAKGVMKASVEKRMEDEAYKFAFNQLKDDDEAGEEDWNEAVKYIYEELMSDDEIKRLGKDRLMKIIRKAWRDYFG